MTAYMRTIFVVLATVVGITTSTSRVHAEQTGDVETTTRGDDYGYKFTDDALLGSTLGTGGDIYSGRKGFQRVLLVRPRTDFVPQLFKSVENI